MALFTAPAGSVNGASNVRNALAAHPKARLVATPHLMLELEQRGRTELEEHSGPLAYPALRAVDAEAKLAGEGRFSLDLDLDLQLSTATNPPSASVPLTRVHFAIGASMQAPLTATAPVPGRTGEVAVLLLSAYLVREEADLRTLFECKMRERQRWLESNPR